MKYLGETIRVSQKYKMPEYLNARIENLSRTINGTFIEEKEDVPDSLESFGDDN